jgi:DNA cross-link repair 1B protein
MKGITVDIDYLHLDNTFANPEYDFPTREEAYKQLKNIITTHNKYRVYMFSYTLGKEEVFMNLAEDFKTLIVIDEDRMRNVKAMDLKPWLWTTNKEEGFIHVASTQ